jgi:hypothetical protein
MVHRRGPSRDGIQLRSLFDPFSEFPTKPTDCRTDLAGNRANASALHPQTTQRAHRPPESRRIEGSRSSLVKPNRRYLSEHRFKTHSTTLLQD